MGNRTLSPARSSRAIQLEGPELVHLERHHYRRRLNGRSPTTAHRFHGSNVYSSTGDILFSLLPFNLVSVGESPFHDVRMESAGGWADGPAFLSQGAKGGNQEVGAADQESGESVGVQSVGRRAIWTVGPAQGVQECFDGTFSFLLADSVMILR
jgi:hypothetical protein